MTSVSEQVVTLKNTFGAVGGFTRPVKLVAKRGNEFQTKCGVWTSDVELIESDCVPLVNDLLSGRQIRLVVEDAIRFFGAEDVVCKHIGYMADMVAQSDCFDDAWEQEVRKQLARAGA